MHKAVTQSVEYSVDNCQMVVKIIISKAEDISKCVKKRLFYMPLCEFYLDFHASGVAIISGPESSHELRSAKSMDRQYTHF